MSRFRSLSLSFLLVLSLTTSFLACGGSSDRLPNGEEPTLENVYAYVLNDSDDSITGFQINADGEVSTIAGSPFQTVESEGEFGVFLMAVRPDNRFLYHLNAEDSSIYTFSIDAETGALTPTGDPVEIGTQEELLIPTAVVISQDSEFMFVAASGMNIGSGEVYVYELDSATGQPTEIDEIGTGPAFGITLDESGEHLYATAFDFEGEFSATLMWAFEVGVDGSLSDMEGSPFTLFDEELPVIAFDPIIHPSDDFMLVPVSIALFGVAGPPTTAHLLGNGSGLVVPFPTVILRVPIEADGSIGEVDAENDVLSGEIDGYAGMVMTPDGQHLYLAEASFEETGAVRGFDVAADGELTEQAGSPYQAGSFLAGIAMSPDGSVVVVSNNEDDNVTAFEVGADGTLTEVEGSPFATGDGPTAIVSTR